jgi:hypothetical protein
MYYKKKIIIILKKVGGKISRLKIKYYLCSGNKNKTINGYETKSRTLQIWSSSFSVGHLAV